MRKTHPIYKAKKGDRFLGLDCVLANEKNLIDVSDQFACGDNPIWILQEK
jgi:hypothetical protein